MIKKLVPITLVALLAVPQISNAKNLEFSTRDYFRCFTQDSTIIKENKLQLRMHVKVDVMNTSLRNMAITDIQEIFFRYKVNDSLSQGYIGPNSVIYNQNQTQFLDKFNPLISKIEKIYSSKYSQNNREIGFRKTLLDTLDIDYRNF